MSYFRRTEDFDICYTDEYKEELQVRSRRERERRERARVKNKKRMEFMTDWERTDG